MSLTTIDSKSVSPNADPVLTAIAQAIDPYLADHPTATFDQYRQSRLNVRLRIVDKDFENMELGERLDLINNYLRLLNDESANQLSFLALVTPEEMASSHINCEFENPTWTDSDEA